MTVTINNTNDRGGGLTAIQAKVTATTSALAAATPGTAVHNNLTKTLAAQQMELVLSALASGRLDPATILSTLS